MNAPFNVDQPSLVAAINNELINQNPNLTFDPRIFNKVIAAANDIVKECASAPKMPSEGMTLRDWLGCGDVGLSSRYMAEVLDGGETCHFVSDYHYPHDVSDFARCVRMVAALDWTERVPMLLGKGKEWDYIARNWKQMVKLYDHKEYNDLSFMLKLARS